MKGNQLILVAFFNFKNKTMEIFNVQIFGSDKDQWLEMSVEDKVEWIRKYTNQQDDAIIEEFINNPKISKDKICLTCGLDKEIIASLEKSSEILGLSDEQHNKSVELVTKIAKKTRKK